MDTAKIANAYIDVVFNDDNRPNRTRLTIQFDSLSEIGSILPLLKQPYIAGPVALTILNLSLGRVREWLEEARKHDIVIPFNFNNVFNLISLHNHRESGIPNSYEKAELIYEYLKELKTKNGLAALPKLRYIPVPTRFSMDMKNVELTFKLINLFEPSDEMWRRVGVLFNTRYRDDDNTNCINEFFDRHRSRDSIIRPVRHAGRDLELPPSDSEEEDSEPRRRNDKAPSTKSNSYQRRSTTSRYRDDVDDAGDRRSQGHKNGGRRNSNSRVHGDVDESQEATD